MARRNRHSIDAACAVETAYVAWEAGDVRAMLRCMHHDLVFKVHPYSPGSFVGQGRGKVLFGRRLESFLTDFEVLNFGVSNVTPCGSQVDCRAHYHYRHKRTGMEIDGSMRHYWRVLDGKVVKLDLITDARRMSAFFELAALSH